MPYPPYLSRQISYRQNESAGNEIPTSILDAEFNDVEEVTNQINQRLRSITNVAGQLINVAAQIAAALVGSQRFTVSGSTTVFLTTITWDSSFSSGNVLVNASGLEIDPNTVTVANNAGFLEVTLATAVSTGWLFVAAYSQGAGILTRLQSTANGDGASLIGIEDAGALYTAVNVEGALAEVMTDLNALLTTLGTLNKLWTSDGVTISGDPASADFDLGGFKVSNMADAVANTDAVTLQQLLAVTQNLDTLLSLFIRADGATPFTGDQSLGGHRLTNLGAGIMNGDAIRFEQFNNIDGGQITTGTVAGPRLGEFVGDTGAGGVKGAVPAPPVGSAALQYFLSADGTFKAVPSNLGGFVLLQDQKASGTPGGAALAAAWTARTLNTEVWDTQNSCTLIGTTQFSLLAGTYRIRVTSPFFRVDLVKLRLRNITDAVTTLVGGQGYSNNGANYTESLLVLGGRFVIAGTKTFELQYFAATAFGVSGTLSGLGGASGTAELEIFTSLELIKE